jgi:hypothetical protein
MFRKKEKAEEGMIEDLDYGRHYTKILLMFIVNSLAFIDSYLIIYDKLPVPYEYIDLVYISVCLLIDIYYTFNKITYMENSDYNAALQDVLKLIDTYLSNTDNVVEESVLYQLQENINEMIK